MKQSYCISIKLFCLTFSFENIEQILVFSLKSSPLQFVALANCPDWSVCQ